MPDYTEMCYTLVVTAPYSTNAYRCNMANFNPTIFSGDIEIEAFGDPWTEYYVTIYHMEDTDEVDAECAAYAEAEVTYCVASTRDPSHPLYGLEWDLTLSNSESGGNHTDAGPTQSSAWSFETPGSGGTMQLTYSFDGAASAQREVAISALPFCNESSSGSTVADTGTLNDSLFKKRLQDSATGPHLHCATHVRQAFCAGGLTTFCNNHWHPAQARLYGDWLTSLGWTKQYEGTSGVGYTPLIGDVAVFIYAEDPSGDGHVCVFDGVHWISDFLQQTVYPSSATPRPYKVYRRTH